MASKRVILAIVIIVFGFCLQKYLGYSPVYKSDKNLKGKTVLITGGNTGIGEAAAIEFAKLGAKIVIASRNDIKSENARMNIIKESGCDDVFTYHLDLENQDSIRSFAKKFDAEHEHLDYLVNNAGVISLRGLGSNGFTRVFNINHLGHFLLTNLLMAKMTKQSMTRPVRIINVSSGAFRMVSSFDYDAIQEDSIGVTGDFQAYAHTKLANIYFSSELHRRYSDRGITAYSVHPGVVKTEIGRNAQNHPFQKFLQLLTSTIIRTPYLGAQTIMYCALDDDVTELSGGYFENCGPAALPGYASDIEASRKLWTESLKLI